MIRPVGESESVRACVWVPASPAMRALVTEAPTLASHMASMQSGHCTPGGWELLGAGQDQNGQRHVDATTGVQDPIRRPTHKPRGLLCLRVPSAGPGAPLTMERAALQRAGEHSTDSLWALGKEHT